MTTSPRSNLLPSLCLLGLLPLAVQAQPLSGPYAPGNADTATQVAPGKHTATIGDLITPVAASGTPGQPGTGRNPTATIDGSGLLESSPGSGFFVHTNNIGADGASMWNTQNMSQAELIYDLGEPHRVAGLYVWNHNEPNYMDRGIKQARIEVSDDGKKWSPVGEFTFQRATGKPELPAEVIPFAQPVKGRYFKINALSRFGSDAFGFSEIRFANADKAYTAPSLTWTPKYERPQHPKLALGQPLNGAENIVFPKGSGIIDITQAPYNAKGDGVTDDTAAIQKALDDHPGVGVTIYLPNGRYLVSDQIRWGGGNNMEGQRTAKQTVLWGQSTRGTIIQLKDNAPGFNDPRNARGVIWTGRAPAQRFGNELHNLTVDTGIGNPGACGIQFIANNQGGVFDVNITSGDGKGRIGLDLGYSDEQGPMLVRNVAVLGFDVGVSSAHGVASWTGEGITVQHPNKVGFLNNGQPASVRHFRFKGDVPAVQNGAGLLVLLDSEINGHGDASKHPAVAINGGATLVRNLKTSGFKQALIDRTAEKSIEGASVAEYRNPQPKKLFTGSDSTLDLPIKESPEFSWPAPEDWAVVDGKDSAAIQRAIDSGKANIFVPKGAFDIDKTIVVRKNATRIFCAKTYFRMAAPLKNEAAPIWRIEDGNGQPVLIEGINCDFSEGPFTFVDHASKRTLILQRSALHGAQQTSYTNSVEGGEVFLDDMVMGRNVFKGQQVWARQFNPEPTGTRLTVDGGSFWALGYKTERF
ncbi:MAG: hypothetical protein HC888_05560, partial [Candidatus Competibacteraceae bacterium]|nr:hypothetical protein [Candidatus Competibacteraceae bacterium]